MKTWKGKTKDSGEKRNKKLKMRCSVCGSSVKLGNNVCLKCGARVSSAPPGSRIDHGSQASPAPKFLGDKVVAFKDSHEGERRHLTILVSDIADYSSLSRELGPEERYEIVAHCFGILGDRISHYGGIMTQVTKGIVKGLFGVPVAYEDHAKKACHAALSILESIGAYEQKLREKTDVELRMRIGLVSGLILTGSVSSGANLDYKDLEDVEDLIPTVQSITLPGKVVVTRSTYNLARDFFEFRPIRKCGITDQEPTVESYELVKPRGFVSSIHAKQVKGLSKFVGREQEMSVLLEAARAAREGRGQVVAVTGDAGVGKSRLAFEFKKRLPEGVQIFLEGHCQSYHGVPPYHPFLDTLRSYFGIRVGENEGSIKARIQDGLTRLVDGNDNYTAPIQEMFAVQVKDEQWHTLQPDDKQKRIFDAIATLFMRMAQQDLMILLVEDLHWIDRISDELLSYLIGRMKDTKILLILLYRPEYAGASRLGYLSTEIHLDQIPSSQLRELVESIVGSTELDDSLMSVIVDKTGGNPLFVEEFTRTLSDRGAIQRRGDKVILTCDVTTDPVPATIQSVISARMDLLGEDLKKTLQIASVIGREFSVDLLDRVAEAGDNLSLHISRLRELEFIYEKFGDSPQEFIFKHALTQEAAYKSLLVQKRSRIHQKTGEAIEELFSDRLEEFFEVLAYHFCRTRNLQKEFQYLKLSALKAQRQNSPWAAFSFADQALRSLKKQPASHENKKREIEVLIVIHWVVRMLDYAPEETEQLLKRGEELSVDLADEKSLSLFRAALCIYYLATGEGNSCRQYSDHLFADSQAIENTVLTKDQLRIMVPIAMDNSMSGLLTARFSQALRVNLRILQCMEEVHASFESYDTPFNAYSFLTSMSAGFSAMLGDFDKGMVLCRKALSVSLKAKNFDSTAHAELYYGIVLSFRGCGAEAIDHLTKSIEYFGKAKVGVAFSASSWSMLGYSDFLVGDLDGARRCMEKAVQMQLDSGILLYLAYIYCNLSMVHLASRDLTSAQNCIDMALEWSQKCNEKHWEGQAKVFAGHILSKSESLKAAKAENLILEGIEILKELSMKPLVAQGYLNLGELYLEVGSEERGLKNLKKAEKMFKQMGMDYWVLKTHEVLGRFEPIQT